MRKPLAFTRDGLLELVRKILPGHPRRQSVAVGQADFWTVHGSETSDSHAFVVELNKNHRANTPVVAVRKPREDASNRSAYSRGKRDIVIDELAKEPFVQVKGRSRWHIYHKGEGVRTLTKRQRVTLFHVVAKIGMPFPIAELGTFISESGLRGRSKYSYRPTLKKILGDELLNIVLVEGFENGKYLVPSTGWSLCWVRQFESPFDSALLHGLRSTSENAHR